MQEKALHPVTGTQQRAWEDADEGEREHEGALCTGIYRHNIQETAERTVRKPSAFCERRHSTLSIRPIVLNVKLLTRFHTVFGTVSICRSTKTLRQRGPAPSSVSLPGLHHLACRSLRQCVLSPVVQRSGAADELRGGRGREVILKFKTIDKNLEN